MEYYISRSSELAARQRIKKMTKLEVIKIGENQMFNRADMTKYEGYIVFELQNQVWDMVNLVKKQEKENQTKEANRKVTQLVEWYTPKLENDETEDQIRELARFYWTE